MAYLIGAQFIFVLLLFLGSSVSQNSQIQALRNSVSNGEISSNYPHAFGNTRLDGYTECLGLSINLDGGRYSNQIQRVLSAPNVGGCKELKAWLKQDPLPQTREHYFRYWHGEVLVLPLFVAFGLVSLHWILFTALLVSLALAIISVAKVSNFLTAFASLTPLVASTNFLMTPLATTQGLSNIAILVAIPLVVRLIKTHGIYGIAIGSALAGALFNFVDLLTTPAIGWALSIFVSILAAKKFTEVQSSVVLGNSAIFWIIGYGVTWMVRWLLAMIVWPPSVVVDDVLHQMLFRIDGENSKVTKQFGAASIDNFRYWFSHSVLSYVLVAVALLLLLWVLIRIVKRPNTDQNFALTLYSSSVIIPIWYELLSNHSQIHTFFSYRSCAIAVGILIASSTYLLNEPYGERT